jgi:hypothetical protein
MQQEDSNVVRPDPTNSHDGWNIAAVPTHTYDCSQFDTTALWPINIKEALSEHTDHLLVLKPAQNSIGVVIPDRLENNIIYRDNLMEILTPFGGGASATRMRGVYQSKTGALVWEDAWLVWSWVAPVMLNEALKATLSFCNQLINQMDQGALLLEINRRPLIYCSNPEAFF